ncbi:hypothetical protein DSO57_1000966 [Entomophthora muscae]|uniref:Uncharacterized protein n=1 Tax=Entomophthora muscae TaxID=34485 RepID=A0ACC2UHZ2_9FUNG|nr:hypothetical protein DSO57_1000966 [Entomophthora muscae]
MVEFLDVSLGIFKLIDVVVINCGYLKGPQMIGFQFGGIGVEGIDRVTYGVSGLQVSCPSLNLLVLDVSGLGAPLAQERGRQQGVFAGTVDCNFPCSTSVKLSGVPKAKALGLNPVPLLIFSCKISSVVFGSWGQHPGGHRRKSL